jgi:hypothetical protein
MAKPDSMVVEVEFTAGVWTDVSQWVDWTAGGSTKFGRQSPFSVPSPGTLTNLPLANDDGRFTPHRQVLADGVTVHPYWPNVLPRKRIRLSYVIAGVPYYRFTGYIKGWPTTMVNDAPRVVINATTRDDRMSRVTMLPPITQAEQVLASNLYYPLTDAAGSSQASEYSGNLGPALAIGQTGAGGPLAFGADGPLTGDGTSVVFAPASASAGQYLIADLSGPLGDPVRGIPPMLAFAVNDAASPASARVLLSFFKQDNGSGSNWTEIGVDTSGRVTVNDDSNRGGAGPLVGSNVCDGGWHGVLIGYTITGVFPTQVMNYSIWVDGVVVASGTSPRPTTVAGAGSIMRVGQTLNASALFAGRISQLMLWNSAASMATAGPAIGGAVTAFVGELVSDRIKRFLGYAGLTAADWNIDTSTVTCGSYPQDGKDIVTACQDMAVTEGGGSVFYFGTDGKAQFRSRVFRKPAAPALTLDNEADLDGQTFAPAFDDTQIVNQEQGSRATATSTASTQTITDAASSDPNTGYGLTNETFTSYAQSDLDVLYNAQDRLAQQRQPAYRLGQVAVDLVTAQTAGLYAAVAATDIGERLRTNNLGPGQAPVTQVDVLAEGWEDTFNANEWTVKFDTSPADNPARAVADDATYSSAQAQADCALSGALTAAVTTVVIASPTAPTFTLAAGAYPQRIQVGEEQIRLNTPPGGAASPQTFTGVTRGVNGTTAAPQANGARVRLAPEVTASI